MSGNTLTEQTKENTINKYVLAFMAKMGCEECGLCYHNEAGTVPRVIVTGNDKGCEIPDDIRNNATVELIENTPVVRYSGTLVTTKKQKCGRYKERLAEYNEDEERRHKNHQKSMEAGEEGF